MSAKRNKKLCYNCEGEIDKDALFCLYCGTDLTGVQQEVPEPPYKASKNQVEPAVQADEALVAPQESSPALAYALLVPGVVFLIFSLFMLFFSNGDTLTLRWDASYWFVYLFISVPLLFIGYRSIKK